MPVFLLVVLVSLLVSNEAVGPKTAPAFLRTETIPFSFGGTPEEQFSRFPDICKTGLNQSPIDINKPITPDPDARITISDTWRTSRRTYEILVNAGHIAQFVDLPSAPKKYITFKGDTYQYSLRHFHFGQNDEEGSEHSLFGGKFPYETHSVFVNTKYNFSDAYKHRNGFIATVELSRIGKRKPKLDYFLSSLSDVTFPNQTKLIKTGTTLEEVIPIHDNFYFYKGSQTEPHCDESLTWIIFDTINTISTDQLAMFRNVLRTPTGEILRKNWRYIQERNGRNIYYSQQQSSPTIVESVELDDMVSVMSG